MVVAEGVEAVGIVAAAAAAAVVAAAAAAVCLGVVRGMCMVVLLAAPNLPHAAALVTLAAFVEQETNYKQKREERRKQVTMNDNKGRMTTARGLWLSSLRSGC